VAVTDDRDLQGLDPYDAFDREADRLYAFFTNVDDDGVWARPSRCSGWTVRDVLGHLRADEDYFQACVGGGVVAFMTEMGERGATDLDSGNRIGVEIYADVPTDALIEEWRKLNTDTRARLRARDGGEVDTSVGGYSARWQAFHLAEELATHADDIGVPVAPDEAATRNAWRAAVDRFALMESKPGARAAKVAGGTEFEVEGVSGTLPDAVFVDAIGGRLPAAFDIDPKVRAALAITP
jgi:uncharacterized protein (TIGR03083 family)